MVHLRIVVPSYQSEHALDLLKAMPSACNVIFLRGAAQKPEGDVILCDIAREDASVVIGDLREMDIEREGSIALEMVDSHVSDAADRAEEAAAGIPADAVIWEEVETRTSENTELSFSFLAFMVLATLIAAVGIYTDQPILIIGAMVVGPEFGPIAGFCVAAVHRRADLARRSIIALIVGFPLAMAITLLVTLLFRATDLAPETIENRAFTQFISHPDFFSFFVACLAGTAGVLSLTSAKSGALIGVLISVTTIPAAANTGVAAAYGDWHEFAGAQGQLFLNLAGILLVGILTLYIQRRIYMARRKRHLNDASRVAAGLPVGRSRHDPIPESDRISPARRSP